MVLPPHCEQLLELHGITPLVQPEHGLGICVGLALGDLVDLLRHSGPFPGTAQADDVHVLDGGFAGELDALEQTEVLLPGI